MRCRASPMLHAISKPIVSASPIARRCASVRKPITQQNPFTSSINDAQSLLIFFIVVLFLVVHCDLNLLPTGLIYGHWRFTCTNVGPAASLPTLNTIAVCGKQGFPYIAFYAHRVPTCQRSLAGCGPPSPLSYPYNSRYNFVPARLVGPGGIEPPSHDWPLVTSVFHNRLADFEIFYLTFYGTEFEMNLPP